jgi:hypothetical protein
VHVVKLVNEDLIDLHPIIILKNIFWCEFSSGDESGNKSSSAPTTRGDNVTELATAVEGRSQCLLSKNRVGHASTSSNPNPSCPRRGVRNIAAILVLCLTIFLAPLFVDVANVLESVPLRLPLSRVTPKCTLTQDGRNPSWYRIVPF